MSKAAESQRTGLAGQGRARTLRLDFYVPAYDLAYKHRRLVDLEIDKVYRKQN